MTLPPRLDQYYICWTNTLTGEKGRSSEPFPLSLAQSIIDIEAESTLSYETWFFRRHHTPSNSNLHSDEEEAQHYQQWLTDIKPLRYSLEDDTSEDGNRPISFRPFDMPMDFESDDPNSDEFV